MAAAAEQEDSDFRTLGRSILSLIISQSIAIIILLLLLYVPTGIIGTRYLVRTCCYTIQPQEGSINCPSPSEVTTYVVNVCDEVGTQGAKGLRHAADDPTTLCVLATDIARSVACCMRGLFIMFVDIITKLALGAVSISVLHTVKRPTPYHRTVKFSPKGRCTLWRLWSYRGTAGQGW